MVEYRWRTSVIQEDKIGNFRKTEGCRRKTLESQEDTSGNLQEVRRIQVEDFKKSGGYRWRP